MCKRFFVLIAALSLLSVACIDNAAVSSGNAGAGSSPSPTSSQTQDTSPTPTPPVDYFGHLSSEHREIVKTWLKTQPDLRPASEDSDSGLIPGNDREWPEGNVKFLRDTVGEKGNQYYAVGDMNQDGETDFAVLLVNTTKPGGHDVADEFALAIFNGPFRLNAKPAYMEKQLHGISNCYIVFDLMEKNHLFLGKFESDVYCATYYKKGKGYRFEDCL